MSVARGAKSREGERPGGLGTQRSSMRGRAWHGGVHGLPPAHRGLWQGAFESVKGSFRCNNRSLMAVWMRVVWQMLLGNLRACRVFFPL